MSILKGFIGTDLPVLKTYYVVFPDLEKNAMKTVRVGTSHKSKFFHTHTKYNTPLVTIMMLIGVGKGRDKTTKECF